MTTGVSTITDIGSRLAAFSIAVTVPCSGRTTYSFSLEWDKKNSDVAYIPKITSGSPEASNQNTVKDSVSSRTFPAMSSEPTGEGILISPVLAQFLNRLSFRRSR
uniref:Uncharacterized protein n=1 Tax=Parascaris univalens TaxID=6257 RepID=A0A915A842_PARUN